MASELKRLKPPDAAEGIHDNLLSVFAETGTQFHPYAAGQDFDRTTVNALLDQQNPLSMLANRACR